ncbi:hypothetical protein B0H15DRAFT_947245 [Mycena belliarum]|uniref:Uncharacterized protein n=1 Tax=Mycena belliarum TaxID=1033014 RepID=A0AAD6XWV2_9AGAR|nr:hypothetical protein B0H15DRAFT_947242 [Mycena belliae]KAJ7093911.1 hypothetical protein B0H15DRAFT_947245 [Mycena belliae]
MTRDLTIFALRPLSLLPTAGLPEPPVLDPALRHLRALGILGIFGIIRRPGPSVRAPLLGFNHHHTFARGQFKIFACNANAPSFNNSRGQFDAYFNLTHRMNGRLTAKTQTLPSLQSSARPIHSQDCAPYDPFNRINDTVTMILVIPLSSEQPNHSRDISTLLKGETIPAHHKDPKHRNYA